MATLPRRFRYDEIDYGDSEYEDGHEYGPLVQCLVCGWTYDATWSDLADDEDEPDWDALHPAHQ